MKNSIILLSLLTPALALGSSFSFKDIEKLGRSSDGTYIALCKNGSTENGLSQKDLITGNVCPSTTAPSFPFIKFLSVSAGGDSCTLSTFENKETTKYKLGKAITVNGKSEEDSQACMIFTEFGIAEGHRISFKKLKYELENTTSKDSEYLLTVAANETQHEVKFPSQGKTDFEIELPETSFTDCASSKGNIRSMLYSVVTRVKSEEAEGIKVKSISIEDLKVEKCN